MTLRTLDKPWWCTTLLTSSQPSSWSWARMSSFGAHLQNWAEERRTFCKQNSVQRSLKQNGSLGEKTWQSISNSISFAMTIIAPNVVLRKLLGSAKKSSKNCQSSNESSSSLTEDRCFGKRSSELMIFATFQAFEVFRLLTIPRLFDDLDKSTTVSSALPPLPTTSSVPSSLGAKSDDPVVFNIEISSAAIHPKPWIKRQ